MRRILLALLIVALALIVIVAAGPLYARRDNARRVKRARELISALEGLEIGKSGYAVTDALAAKFGNAPPPKEFRGHYNRENCSAPDRHDSCSYIIAMNNSPLLRYHLLTRLGVREWFGEALVIFSSGTVSQYYFWVWYKAYDGNWRGFGARSSQSLPTEPELPSAHISDSYSVTRVEMKVEAGNRGLGLQSALTPAASAGERERALRIDFGCLALRSGCGETCDVMPEAWRDFYEKLGRLEVEKLGSSYLLCDEGAGPPWHHHD